MKKSINCFTNFSYLLVVQYREDEEFIFENYPPSKKTHKTINNTSVDIFVYEMGRG